MKPCKCHKFLLRYKDRLNNCLHCGGRITEEE